MAIIYEKPPFFKLSREWDAKTKLPEVYKLQSNNPRTKCKAKIHKDLGTLGIEFTLDQTITVFITNSVRINLDYVQSFSEFGNMLQGWLLSDWKHILTPHWSLPGASRSGDGLANVRLLLGWEPLAKPLWGRVVTAHVAWCVLCVLCFVFCVGSEWSFSSTLPMIPTL